MIYNINLKNQLKTVRGLIYGIFVYSLLIVVMYYLSFDIELLYSLTLSFVAIFILPAVFLQLEYYLINRKNEVKLDLQTKKITFNNDAPISFSQIEKIIIFMTPVAYRKAAVSFASFDSYKFAVIKLRTGDDFIFTFLMEYDVEYVMNKIEGVSIERKRMLFPTTLFRR